MAADSDGNVGNLTAVVICEGDYHDPTFPQKLNNLVARLNSLIEEQPKSKRLKVNKVSVAGYTINMCYLKCWAIKTINNN